MALWNKTTNGDVRLPSEFLHDDAKAIIREDPVCGKELLRRAFRWVSLTRGYQDTPPSVSDNLRNWLGYRSLDIADESVYLDDYERKTLLLVLSSSRASARRNHFRVWCLPLQGRKKLPGTTNSPLGRSYLHDE
jgi:hypothetical protein